jgi:hypothetical protein
VNTARAGHRPQAHIARTTTPAPLLAPLVSEYADDPEMSDILGPYVARLVYRGSEIEVALAWGDHPSLGVLARDIKGSAAGYGFPSISAAAAGLESAIARGDKAATIWARAEELTSLMLRARARSAEGAAASAVRSRDR